MIERNIYTDVAAMELFLEENLQGIVWPRETNVSAEILDGGKRVFIDVDLSEIEDMPSKTASVPQRGYKLSVKDMSPAQVQRLYMRHVHGIGFRIISEAFAALPSIQEIILSPSRNGKSPQPVKPRMIICIPYAWSAARGPRFASATSSTWTLSSPSRSSISPEYDEAGRI
jgi:hypothetical protein